MVRKEKEQKKAILGARPVFSYPLLLWVVSAVALGAPSFAPSRVSYVEGIVAFEQRDQLDWSSVTVNLPVGEGDHFVLQEESRMEFEFDDGSFLRLGSISDAQFRTLSERKIRVQLSVGHLILRVNGSTSYQIVTSLAEISVKGRSVCRVDVAESGQTRVVVRKGVANVMSDVGREVLRVGEVLTIQDRGELLRQTSYLKDDFDFWSDRRDARHVTNDSKRYLGQAYVGAYDLDQYGRWGYVSSYGFVWWPQVKKNWCPYREGRWFYRSGWGWTWVSYERWGWLPYHYGAWVYLPYDSRWCWVPRRLSRWSPATVNFYVGENLIGWSPRRPGERKMRRRGDGAARGTLLRSRRSPLPRGLTVMPQEDFLAGGIPRSLSLNPETVQGLRPMLPHQLKKLLASRLGSKETRTGSTGLRQFRKREGWPTQGRLWPGLVISPPPSKAASSGINPGEWTHTKERAKRANQMSRRNFGGHQLRMGLGSVFLRENVPGSRPSSRLDSREDRRPARRRPAAFGHFSVRRGHSFDRSEGVRSERSRVRSSIRRSRLQGSSRVRSTSRSQRRR